MFNYLCTKIKQKFNKIKIPNSSFLLKRIGFGAGNVNGIGNRLQGGTVYKVEPPKGFGTAHRVEPLTGWNRRQGLEPLSGLKRSQG
jgi:hypothetical protein